MRRAKAIGVPIAASALKMSSVMFQATSHVAIMDQKTADAKLEWDMEKARVKALGGKGATSSG